MKNDVGSRSRFFFSYVNQIILKAAICSECRILAAFALGGFHGLDSGGSKFLIFEAWLLPLRLAGFMGSIAEAANS